MWEERISEFHKGVMPISRIKESTPNYGVYGILAEKKHKSMLEFRNMGYYTSGVHLPNTYYSVFGEQDHLPGVQEFYNKFLAIPCGWWM